MPTEPFFSFSGVIYGSLVLLIILLPFFFLWKKTARLKVQTGEEALQGDHGIALTSFRDGTGTIRLEGEIWEARTNAHQSIAKGDRVRVVSRDGLCLFVELSPRKKD